MDRKLRTLEKYHYMHPSELIQPVSLDEIRNFHKTTIEVRKLHEEFKVKIRKASPKDVVYLFNSSGNLMGDFLVGFMRENMKSNYVSTMIDSINNDDQYASYFIDTLLEFQENRQENNINITNAFLMALDSKHDKTVERALFAIGRLRLKKAETKIVTLLKENKLSQELSNYAQKVLNHIQK